MVCDHATQTQEDASFYFSDDGPFASFWRYFSSAVLHPLSGDPPPLFLSYVRHRTRKRMHPQLWANALFMTMAIRWCACGKWKENWWKPFKGRIKTTWKAIQFTIRMTQYCAMSVSSFLSMDAMSWIQRVYKRRTVFSKAPCGVCVCLFVRFS